MQRSEIEENANYLILPSIPLCSIEATLALPPQPNGYEHCCDPAKLISCARAPLGLKNCKTCKRKNPLTYSSCFKCGMAISGALRSCGCDWYVPKGTCDLGCNK